MTSPSCVSASLIGQGGGASADWQAVGQSPAVVGRVPGVEKSLSGAVLSGARLDRWIRPRPSSPHPVTLSHTLLHRDPRLTEYNTLLHTHTHSHTLTHTHAQVADPGTFWCWSGGCDQWRVGTTWLHITRYAFSKCTSATWQPFFPRRRPRGPHVTSIHELIGYATPAGSGAGR